MDERSFNFARNVISLYSRIHRNKNFMEIASTRECFSKHISYFQSSIELMNYLEKFFSINLIEICPTEIFEPILKGEMESVIYFHDYEMTGIKWILLFSREKIVLITISGLQERTFYQIYECTELNEEEFYGDFIVSLFTELNNEMRMNDDTIENFQNVLMEKLEVQKIFKENIENL